MKQYSAEKFTAMFARILLLISSIYVFWAAAYSEFNNTVPWNFYSSYTFILLTFILLTTIFSIYHYRIRVPFVSHQDISQRSSLDLKSTIGYVCFCVSAWFFIRFPILNKYPLWFDEAAQFIPFWNWGFSIDSVLYAAKQQQMPLDYYISYTFFRLFGASELSVLFNPVLFSILSCIVFILIQLQLRWNIWLAIFSFIIFLSQPTLLRYSSEARPISIALFFSLLTVYFLYAHLKQKIKNHSLLFTSAALSCLSIGLQPIFFTFFLSICLIIIFYNKNRKVCWKYFAAVFVLPNIVSLPIIVLIYKNSFVGVQQFKNGSLIHHIWTGVLNFKPDQLSIFIEEFRSIEWLLLFPLVFLLIFIDRKLEKLLKSNFKNIVGLTIGIVLFPISFLFMWNAIDWDLQSHYFFLWTVLIIILLLEGIHVLLDEFHNESAILHNKFLKKALLAILLVTFTPKYLNTNLVLLKNKKQYLDIRNLIAEEDTVKYIYFFIPIFHPDDAGHFLNYTGRFYNSENRHFLNYENQTWLNLTTYYSLQDLVIVSPTYVNFNPTVPKDFKLRILIYYGAYITNPYQNQIHEIIKKDSLYVRELPFSYYMYELETPMGYSATISNIIEKLNSLNMEFIWNSKLKKMQITSDIYSKNFDSAQKRINALSEVVNNSTVDDAHKTNIQRDLKAYKKISAR